MKYLVVDLMMISSINLLGQNKDNSEVDSVFNDFRSSYSLSVAVEFSEFNSYLLGISYIYRSSKNFGFPLEVQYLSFTDLHLPIISASIRYYPNPSQNKIIYLQSGIGFLGFLFPTPNVTVGFIFLKNINIEMKILPILGSKKSNSPMYVSIGWYF